MFNGMLSKNILATVAYYDGMNYPLTSFEVWSLMLKLGGREEERKFSLAEVIEEMEKGSVSRLIEGRNGFYFLKGRANLVEERIERNKVSDQKLRKIIRGGSFLRFIPFLEMIAVSGRVAMKNSVPKSDLDILIAFKKGHIFLGRFFTVLLLGILGERRHDDKIKDKICLNHFVSDEFEISVKDIFSSHEYVFLIPLFNFEAYGKFMKKNEDWILRYRPNFGNEVRGSREIVDTVFSKNFRKIGEIVFGSMWLEKFLKKIQTEKIENNPKTKTKGSVIIYSEKELAFWPEFEKHGPRIFEKFQEKLSDLGRGGEA